MWRNPAFFGRIQQKLYTLFLLFVITCSQLTVLEYLIPTLVEAAVVTIDGAVSTTANSSLFSGSQLVFISDQVGYKFYRDSDGRCKYSKTSDGGTSWGVAVIVDNQTDCINISVWYDQWTPGDFGTYIHIGTMENGSTPDNLFYNRLDTVGDVLLNGINPTNVTAPTSQGGTYVSGTNFVSITKATNGVLYMMANDASDSFVLLCSTTCETDTNWSEAGTSIFDGGTNDWSIMTPLFDGAILVINRDISANDVRSRVWNGSSWSVSWNAVDTNAPESGTHKTGLAATIDHVTGDVYLIYASDNDNYTGVDHDIRTAIFSAGSWTQTADVFTNSTGGLHGVAIAQDTNTGDIYAVYVLRTTIGTATTGNVYYATSTSAMSAWSSQVGPVNLVSQNLYAVDANVMSDERIYATWYDPNLDDILGETLADIAPITKLTTRGTPTATINASTSNQYVGGTFVIRESQSSRSVTDIIVSERGTIAGNTAVQNVRLFYDLDTSAPYDCASESYGGGESQFGLTDTNGFSGADGTSAFSGLVTISTTQAMCVYVVLDVTDAALDGDTLSLSVESPNDDVLVTGGVDVVPNGPVRFSTSTVIVNDEVTQTGFHWRNDNGSEVGATSATLGVENTVIPALQTGNPRRLRIGVSNEGSLAAPASTYRLEYAPSTGSCSETTGWTDVGATDDAWNMYDSTFITDGDNTTNITVPSGGVTDQNSSYLVSNGGLRDTSSETGSLTLTSTNFVDLEFSVIASSSAVEGTTYCFRVTAAGTPLPVYSVYPELTVAADLSVTATGTLEVTTLSPATNFYTGGAFVLRENVATRTVSSITITATGTVNAATDLDNIRLFYDLDTSAPYNCASESYNGTEPQFGATDTDGFSSANGSSTFTGSVAVATTSTLCVYVVLDVLDSAINGETLRLSINRASTDVVVNDGSVSPSTPISISGTTTFAGAVVTQTGYHWRFNDGTEIDATSATLGSESVPVTDMTQNTPVRLRIGISNEGAATSATSTYRLEFGPKLTTCENISVWSSVGALADDWNMFDSIDLTEGDSTTNIAIGSGGVTDGNSTFKALNGGVRDVTSTTSPVSLTIDEFTELEFSITSTNITAFSTTYCFRVTAGGTPLPAYSTYAEITTGPKRDFVVRRGVTEITGTSTTLIAGSDYVAPASTSSAFVRITDTHHTAAGDTGAGGGSLNADDATAHIGDASDLTTSFTLTRPGTALGNTRVTWEIVEFIGDPGTDNEMVVRSVGSLLFTNTDLSMTGASVPVADDSDVVVYVTGISNNAANRNLYYAGQVSAEWNSVTNEPILTRGATGNIAINASYAVVEYTGQNWRVQRVEHTYSTTTVTETESITPVNSLARTFIHTQKRMGALGNVNNFGHEVWLSSIGAVSFRLESAATSPASHVSVAWVIENQQTSGGAMKVQRTNGTTNGGTEPVTIPISIFTPIESVTNSSIFATSRVVGANSNFPLVFAGARITGTTTYELWRSEASADLTYRTEIVEWPINGLAVRQNYYRFYVDNNETTPDDPWPPGPTDLGENTVISAADEPLGDGDRVRLRMSYRVANATFPAGLYDFKLQYGLRSTPSCTAIATWTDVGAAGSGAIWRGYAATGTTNGANLADNPAQPGELLLSVSDVGGSLIEENPAPANPYLALAGDDVEYDWFIEHNGAIERSFYCFRMVRSDGTTLDGYFNYPQMRTAGYSPVTKNWRFYSDELNETPTSALAAESIAPIEVANEDIIALRVTVGERKNVDGQNVKFRLQYDESNQFTNPRDVVATSSCTATSTWCYAIGGGTDNATITTSVLSDADSCVASVGAGCGTHNSSGDFVTGFTHPAGANREFSFYLRHAAARAGAVYYFRLYETLNDLPVVPQSGDVYPSLVAETAKLSMTVNGLNAGTTTAGVVLTASSSPIAIAYGSLSIDTDEIAAHRIGVTTNATEGYRVLMQARQQLLNTYGTPIAPITGTNNSPVAWAVGCSVSADGCVGYHTTDATLSAPSSTRFAALDSYAGLPLTPVEVMYSPIPTADIHDIVYRVRVRPEQPAGDYETEIIYIAIPTY